MRLMLLNEDYEKVVAIVRKLRPQIDAKLSKFGGSGDKSFIIANVLHHSRLLYDSTTEERSEVFNILSNHYNVDRVDLIDNYTNSVNDSLKSYDDDHYNVADEKPYSPEDWLYDYARHNHIPVHRDDVIDPDTLEFDEPESDEEVRGLLKSVGLDRESLKSKSLTDLLRLGLKLQDVVKIKKSGGFQESLYGFMPRRSSKKIDMLIDMVDRSFLDFDYNNEKFKNLVVKVYGKLLTQDELIHEIAASSQSSEFKDVLANHLAGTGVSKSSGGNGKLQPATITMKRGTIINADHAVKHQKYGQPYLLVGINPGTYTRFASAKPGDPPFRPEFMTIGSRQAVKGKPRRKIVTYFKKILSMNLDNIADIKYL